MIFFEVDFLNFLADLEVNNNREWFNANKNRFKTKVETPFQTFIERMIVLLQKEDPRIKMTAKESIFRIYKDVRFSKDKSPYKTHMSALITAFGKKEISAPGFYLEFRADRFHIYSGIYEPGPEILHKIRTYIATHLNEFKKLYLSKSFIERFGEIRGEKNKVISKEFKEVAFKLAEGEISEPFETDFGFHIILVEKIKGQELELRHILLTPTVSDASIKEAKEKIDLIRKRIIDKEITFAEAARTISDEKETRANGGALINPKTQDTRFELTKMDPSLYSRVSNLKDQEISQPFLEEDQGKKTFKIITVTNRIDEHTADYSKDYIKIKDLALKEKQIKAVGKWFEEKIKETYIKINGEYRDCAFTNNWLKK